MKRRFLAGMLSMALVATAFTGCGSSSKETAAPAEGVVETANFNAEGYPIVNDEITLKVLLGIRDVDTLIDINDMPAIQRLEEQTGIHVEWEVVKGADWDTKLNLMFASGDYPDVILSCNTEIDDEEYGVSQGILIPLEEMIDQYMPNFTARRDAEDSDPTVGLVASDGHTYSVGYLVGQNINTNQHYFINQEWLNNLGLDMPKNVDELTTVLEAFATQDPDGDGVNDQIAYEMGLDTGFYSVKYMLPMFGVPCDPDKWIYLDDNKQVQFTATQDGFRECMEWLNKLYSEGVIDPEVASQDINTIETKLKAGNIGFFTAWRLLVMGFDDGVAKDCVLYTPDSSASLYRYIEMAKSGAFVTVANQHVPETMRWLDAMLETETMFSLYYGEQDANDGSGWTYNENGKIDSTNDGSVEVKNFIDCNALFFAPGKYIGEAFNMPVQRLEKTDYCQQYDAAGIIQKYSDDYLDLAPLTSEQLQQSVLLETDINNAVVENIASFVVNGVTDENWNSFVDMFDGMGVDGYVQMYQDAIDTMDIQ